MHPENSTAATRIAFLKLGSFSQVNTHLLRELGRVFPNHPIDVFDIEALTRKTGKRWYKFAKRFHAWREYPWSQLTHPVDYVFDKTTWYMSRMRETIEGLAIDGRHWFTFQTQFLFDGSIKGLPHFVLTDYTGLANQLRNPPYPVNYNRSWLRMEAEGYHRADLVFVNSEFSGRSLVEQYGLPRSRVVNVGSGCNIEVKLPLRNQEFRNKRILFVGIDWERKGGPLLVSAFRRIREKHPDAHLTIIGCEPKLNIANCDVMGKVPLDQMPGFFQEASIFCFPSEVEPLGIALYEAALYGLGICSTRYEAAEEFLQHEQSVLFNESGDAETLYQNLLRLIENPELCRAYGAKAQSIAKARFDWTRVGDEIGEAILNRLGRVPC